MLACPACGAETPDGAGACPVCRLAVGLYAPVKEAAGPGAADDPVYLSTIAELIRSVDLEAPPAEAAPSPARIAYPSRFPGLRASELPPATPTREPSPLHPLEGLPMLPAASTEEELRRRAEEYLVVARRLGLDVTDLSERGLAALQARDTPSLDAVVRELFVHVASALAEEYEVEMGRRNELAQFAATPSADVELEALRKALGMGDLSGGLRRLVHVRDILGRMEEQWATGRVLLAECDLLAETIRELGVDPTPALGPLEEGRKSLGTARRDLAERLLARAAFALWAVLEPTFLEELKRLRDRLVAARDRGIDIKPALSDLRDVAEQLRRRNFGGTVTAYRRLRSFGHSPNDALPAVSAAVVAPAGPERPAPSV